MRSPARAIELRQAMRTDLVVAPGAFDAYSALLVEGLGFRCVYLGGNAMGLHCGKGQPFVSVTETADAVARVSRAVQIPVIADMGAGFGEAAHCFQAMRDLEHAGAAAVHIDDQPFPKRASYHRGRGEIASVRIVQDRLKAALDARRDESVLVIARTDALRVTQSVEETLERAAQLIETGVDGLLVLDLDPSRAGRFCVEFPGLPIGWIGGIAEPVPTASDLRKAGFGFALYPFNATAAVTQALEAVWRPLAQDGRPAPSARPASESLARAMHLVGMDRFWSMEQRGHEEGDPA